MRNKGDAVACAVAWTVCLQRPNSRASHGSPHSPQTKLSRPQTRRRGARTAVCARTRIRLDPAYPSPCAWCRRAGRGRGCAAVARRAVPECRGDVPGVGEGDVVALHIASRDLVLAGDWGQRGRCVISRLRVGVAQSGLNMGSLTIGCDGPLRPLRQAPRCGRAGRTHREGHVPLVGAIRRHVQIQHGADVHSCLLILSRKGSYGRPLRRRRSGTLADAPVHSGAARGRAVRRAGTRRRSRSPRRPGRGRRAPRIVTPSLTGKMEVRKRTTRLRCSSPQSSSSTCTLWPGAA